MKKTLIIICSTILILAVIVGGGMLYVINTPEYALAKLCDEVRDMGFDAVLPKLTDEACEKVAPVLKIINNNVVQSILAFLSDDDYSRILVEKASEIEWSVGDILKNNKKASVTIGFNYVDKIVGSIDLELLKIDGDWKINDLYNLDVDKIS